MPKKRRQREREREKARKTLINTHTDTVWDSSRQKGEGLLFTAESNCSCCHRHTHTHSQTCTLHCLQAKGREMSSTPEIVIIELTDGLALVMHTNTFSSKNWLEHSNWWAAVVCVRCWCCWLLIKTTKLVSNEWTLVRTVKVLPLTINH